MSEYVNHISTDKSVIIVRSKGDPITVDESQASFHKVKTLLAHGKFNDALNMADPCYLGEGTEFEIKNGSAYIGGYKIPSSLSRRLVQFKNLGLDTKPLEKFWHRLRKNPLESSRQDLWTYLEKQHAPITREGRFIAYKQVRNNFKDFHTGKLDNTPGQIVKMPREKCDSNRHNTCSTGLHVAAFMYAGWFKKEGKLLEIEVDPQDVVSVPVDYNNQKTRVCRYNVLREVTGEWSGYLYDPDRPDEEARNPLYTDDKGGGAAVTTGEVETDGKDNTKIVMKTKIVRLSKEQKRIETNRKNQAKIPFETLAKFNLEQGETIWAAVPNKRKKAVVILFKEEDLPDNAIASKEISTKTTTLIPKSLFDAAGISKAVYSMTASKGTLEIR